MFSRKMVRSVVKEIQKHGLDPEVGLTKKCHYRVRWTQHGRNRSIYFGSSPSDVRSMKNTMSTLRRMLSEKKTSNAK